MTELCLKVSRNNFFLNKLFGNIFVSFELSLLLLLLYVLSSFFFLVCIMGWGGGKKKGALLRCLPVNQTMNENWNGLSETIRMINWEAMFLELEKHVQFGQMEHFDAKLKCLSEFARSYVLFRYVHHNHTVFHQISFFGRPEFCDLLDEYYPNLYMN
ncbi:hypothetical protein RFI_20437, partial [Reticulomyxa filosa]